MSIPLPVLQFLFTVGSIIYQQRQAEKARAAALDRAATKDIRLSGSNSPVPLVYGYSRVEPINVYTNSYSNFVEANSLPPVINDLGNIYSNIRHVVGSNGQGVPLQISKLELYNLTAYYTKIQLYKNSAADGNGTDLVTYYSTSPDQRPEVRAGGIDLVKGYNTGFVDVPGTGLITLQPGESLVVEGVTSAQNIDTTLDQSGDDIYNFCKFTAYFRYLTNNELGNLLGFNGSNNELLVTQNVLSAAALNKVVWADVDQVSFDNEIYYNYVKLNANTLGSSTSGYPQVETDRPGATFENLSYTTEFFKMNRQKPQFSGKPITAYYVEGRKIRTLSNGVLSTERTFNNNAINVLLDYMLDSEFGPGLSIEDFDLDSIQTAVDIANIDVHYYEPLKGYIFEKQGITGRWVKFHEFNGNLYPDKNHFSNISEILDTIPGAILFRDPSGKIKLNIPNPLITNEVASVGEITDTYLIEDLSFSQSDSNTRLNKIKVSYPNSHKNFANDSYELAIQEYLDQDNGINLVTELSPKGIVDQVQATMFARVKLNESRISSYTFKTSHEMLIYQPGDIVKLFSEYHNIDDYVRIVNVEMNPNLTIDFTAVQYIPGVYNPAVVGVTELVTYDDFDFRIKQPSNFTANVVSNTDSVLNSVELTWTDADDANVNSYILQVGTVDPVTNFIVWSHLAESSYGINRFIHSPNVPTNYYYKIQSKGSDEYSWVSPISGAITLQQILGGLAINNDRESLVINRSLLNGQTFPATTTINYTVSFGGQLGTYSPVGSGDIPSKGWRITNLNGGLDQNQGTFVVNANGSITISFNQTLLDYIPNNELVVSFLINQSTTPKAETDLTIIPLTKVFQISEVKDAADITDGSTYSRVDLYKRATNTPVKPTTNVTVSFGPFAVNNAEAEGWYPSIPAGTDPVYVSSGIASVVGSTGTDSNIAWTDPVIAVRDGNVGSSYYEASAFIRSAAIPSTPIGGSFNFGTNVLTPPTGWSSTPIDGTDPLWVVTYLFQVQGDTGTDTATTWSTPIKSSYIPQIGVDYVNGQSVYTAVVYLLSSTAPATPSGGSYDFGSNILTAPSGWTNVMPNNTSSGGKVYRSEAQASISGATGIDSSLSWSTPILMVQNGLDGTNGTNGVAGEQGPRSATGYLYYTIASTSAPSSPTLSGYNFSTGTFSTISSNWSTTPVVTQVPDYSYYAIRYSVTEITFGGSQTITKSSVYESQNFDGIITFTNIQDGVSSTVIDGDQITTGTITANRIGSGTSSVSNGTFALGSTTPVVGLNGTGIFTRSDSFGFGLAGINSGSGGGSAGVVGGSTSFASYTYGVIGYYTNPSYTSTYGVGVIGSNDWGAIGNYYGGAGGGGMPLYEGRVGGNGVAIQAVQQSTLRIVNLVQADWLAVAYKNNEPIVALGQDASPNYCIYSWLGKGQAHFADGVKPFTGVHDGVVESSFAAEVGDILVDEQFLHAVDVSNTIVKMRKSTSANQKGVIGVFTEKYDDAPFNWKPTISKYPNPKPGAKLGDEATLIDQDVEDEGIIQIPNPEYYDIQDYKVVNVNALGEGMINVCGEGGDIEIGDLIVTSSIPGKGMKQSDDLIRNITVAKSRTNVTFDSPTEVKQIACIYLAG